MMARWWSDPRSRGPTAPRAASLSVALFQTRAVHLDEYIGLQAGVIHTNFFFSPLVTSFGKSALPSACSGAEMCRRVIPARPPIVSFLAI